MFKAKLIENEKYFKLKRKLLFLQLIPILIMGLIINTYQFPIWVIVLIVFVYIAMIILQYKFQKQINALLFKRIIEIDENEIRIISKNKKPEIIKLDSVEKLLLKKEYSMSDESLKYIAKAILGKPEQSFLIFHQKDIERKLLFDIDSYYAVIQLNKLIEAWERIYCVERI